MAQERRWNFEDGRRALASLAPHLQSRERWEARAARVRQGILDAVGPRPAPSSEAPILRNRRQRDGYSIENVQLEGLRGNLYRSSRPGKRPGILVPHGHFRREGWFARTCPEMQSLCAHLAQMGAVVFTWDMVGWGEALYAAHTAPDVLALQLWNSLRAVDFLESLADRIAVTGASGGASQAILLGAVDDRLFASAPLVMVSASYAGGCHCEVGMPIRPDSNNAEIAALFAPRPQLLVSDGADWTAEFPDVELPFLQAVYGLYGAPVENLHLAGEGHDLGPQKRRVVYQFFARHLGLDDTLEESAPLESHPSLLSA